MIRIVLTCALAVSSALAQTAGAPGAQVPPAAPNSQAPAAQAGPSKPRPIVSPADQLAPDAVVIAIHGLCPGGKSGDPAKPDSCATNVTKEQFNQMIAAMNFNAQMRNPVALRTFAESYAQALALVDAAETAGVDKDPQFQELMRIVRVRTLADAYRRILLEKYSNPAPQEIEAYYRQNLDKYERLDLDRIFIPRTSSKAPQGNRAEFEKKAQLVAGEIRERAAKGEDMYKLQVEA